MEENSRKLAKDRQLFHGAMGAGLSHEINNVFAIIGELSGLLQDLSAAGGDHRIAPSKLDSVLSRIDTQVDRGRVLVKLLNQFSHSPEIAEQDLVVSDVLRHMIALSGRLARLKKVTIITDDPLLDDTVHGDLFNLQHALFRCIEIALLASRTDTTLNATLSRVSSGIRFSLRNEQIAAVSTEIEEKVATAATIAKRLGGDLDADMHRAPFEIGLSLPNQLRPLVH